VPAPGTVPHPELDDHDDDREKADKKSAATLLVGIAQDRYTFGVSRDGEAYGLPHGDPRVVLMLRGGKTSLRGQLARVFFAKFGKATSQQALADALLVVEGIAQEAEPTRLFLRTGELDGALWLDLGDQTGRAVRITAAGWTVEDRSPVLFKRTALNGPLPAPAPGGDLAALWRWLNVSEPDRPLVLAWLVASLLPDIPHPILGLFGEQGTGKTTAEKILVSVLDPGPVPIRKPPRDVESWVTAAAGSWMVGLDNLSSIPEWLSDSLCRASTGDGDVRRKLYTDGELAVFAFRRCIVLCGIDVGAFAGDLADRLLSIDLEPIADNRRIRESDLWPSWERAHPAILGAVLDLMAGVAGVLPSVHLETAPRMADFAHVLRAVDLVLGTDSLPRYVGKQRSVATDSLTDDPFIGEVQARIGEGFEGTAAVLLREVTPDDDGWRAPKGWPGTARTVTQRLKRQGPPMRKAGWALENLGDNNKDGVTVWRIIPPRRPYLARNPSPPSPPSPRQAGWAGMAGMAGMKSGPSKDVGCTACCLPLDPALAADGETTHPTCG
jgi:hypothetical protein